MHSIGSKPSGEDFVQPPLPPPPPDAFLNSQTSASNGIGNGIKSYTRAKPAVWSPTLKKNDDELPLPPPPAADEVPASSPTPGFYGNKPKGFRSVSGPATKDCNNDKGSNLARTEVPYPGRDRISPIFPKNGTSSPCTLNSTGERPLSSMSNSSQMGGYVTLLRDTRRILIKSSNGAAPPKMETSSTYSIQGTPFPPPPNDAKVTPSSQLPEGAVYQTTTQEGNLVHTDTYYPATADAADNQSVVLERTKKTTVVRAPHHSGIGPVNDHGVPVALKTTVDDSKHWYKNMFKQMHKIEQEDASAGQGRTYSFEEATPVNDRTAQHHVSMEIEKPKKVGRITDYKPAEPYVVENQPQTKNVVPAASTSYKPPSPRKTAETTATSPSAASYTAYRNAAMSASAKPPAGHSTTKQQKQDEGKLRQPARAKFDFAAQTSKEMAAKKDQTIIVTKRVDENWYMAETVDGKKSGIIPVQYVEIISTTSSPEKPLRNGQAKAKFDFAGKTKVELSFSKDDEIVLLKKVDANWYKGRIGSKTGILPAVYIDVIVEPEATDGGKPKQKIPKELEASPKAGSPRSTTSSQSSQHAHSLSQASSSSDPDETERKQRAAFLAHSVVDAAVQLQPKDAHKRGGEFDLSELDRAVDSLTQNDGDFPAPPPAQTLLAPSVPSYPSSNISSQPSTPRLHTPPPSGAQEVDFGQVIGRYVALYPYEASNDDELDLLTGDVIMVVETCDDGWFVGTCQRTGAFGTFPGNYVTLANS